RVRRTAKSQLTKAPPPPEESSRWRDAEVSWLGVIARRRLPGALLQREPVVIAAGSPLTVAGAAPVLHGTSLSHRKPAASMPEARKGAAARVAQFLVGQPLPVAKALLREIGDSRHVRAGDRVGAGQAGTHDRARRLVGAAQIAGHPDRVARQLTREAGEDGRVGTVAGHVLLAVDAALMRDRGMPDPPEARRRRGLVGAQAPIAGRNAGRVAHLAAATSSMTISPICWK